MNETRETMGAIRLLGLHKVIYYRLFYRHHMRWLHRRGRHVLTHIGPMEDGAEMDKCHWCGHVENFRPGTWTRHDWDSVHIGKAAKP